METSNNPRRISRSKAILLVGLALLVVAGGAALISIRMLKTTGRSHPSVQVPANSTSAMFGFDLQHTHFNSFEHILSAINVSHLVSYWKASTRSYILSSPAVANRVVYIGSNDGLLYALDAKTGKTLWLHVAKSDVGSSPAVANGILYVGSDDHTLYALNAATGATVWTYTTGNAIWSSPAVANGIVYVGSNDSNLYALDALTGKVRWTHATENFVSSSPAVVNGVVYVGCSDGNDALELHYGRCYRFIAHGCQRSGLCRLLGWEGVCVP